MLTANRVHRNNDLAKSLVQVVDAGWANKSDGGLESSFGRFALITITPNEISELYSAVFNDDHTPSATLQPGNYLFCQNNEEALALDFVTAVDAEYAYTLIAREFERAWKRQAIAADIEAMGRFFEEGDLDEEDDEDAGDEYEDFTYNIDDPGYFGRRSDEL
jgi:hypothetical protein